MKTVIYDLSKSVDLSEEDAQVFAMVNRGADQLAGRQVVESKGILYLEKRPSRISQIARLIFSCGAGVVIVACLFTLIEAAVILMVMPQRFPLLSLVIWFAFIAALIVPGRRNHRR